MDRKDRDGNINEFMVWDEESGFTACSPRRAQRVPSIVARESHSVPGSRGGRSHVQQVRTPRPPTFWCLCCLLAALDRNLFSLARRTMTATPSRRNGD